MKRYATLLFALFATGLASVAQTPLYIVNGAPREDIRSIPPEDIDHTEMLPADEQTIARYGQQASNGVMLITLRYDEPARFEAAPSFAQYIAGQVKWDAEEPTARVILRYTITPEGRAEVSQELESTDSRLKRRILKAIAGAPAWRPAVKQGRNIASEGVLNLCLPLGKQMPQPIELVWR